MIRSESERGRSATQGQDQLLNEQKQRASGLCLRRCPAMVSGDVRRWSPAMFPAMFVRRCLCPSALLARCPRTCKCLVSPLSPQRDASNPATPCLSRTRPIGEQIGDRDFESWQDLIASQGLVSVEHHRLLLLPMDANRLEIRIDLPNQLYTSPAILHAVA